MLYQAPGSDLSLLAATMTTWYRSSLLTAARQRFKQAYKKLLPESARIFSVSPLKAARSSRLHELQVDRLGRPTRSWAVNSGANSRARTWASACPVRKAIKVPGPPHRGLDRVGRGSSLLIQKRRTSLRRSGPFP